MHCDDARRHLDALPDGDLAADERAALDAHLAGCPDCRAAAATLDHTCPRTSCTCRGPRKTTSVPPLSRTSEPSVERNSHRTPGCVRTVQPIGTPPPVATACQDLPDSHSTAPVAMAS